MKLAARRLRMIAGLLGLVVAAAFAGAASGNVTITSNGSNPTLNIALTGTGVTAGTLSANPTSLSFGSVQVGSNTIIATMTPSGGTAQTLPVVFFNNLDPNDLLPADTTITLRVNMTNAVGTDAHTFDPTVDSVYVNGIPSFLNWDAGTLAAYQLTNNPVGSGIYTLDLLLAKGSPVQQTYKYGINGNDDEAGAGNNHVRYVRSTGTYVMPLDTFGNPLVEASFGNLKASPSTAAHVLISWLGRPGVHLQTKSSLTGSWTDHPETDSLSSTNWPSSGGPTFFRLIKQ